MYRKRFKSHLLITLILIVICVITSAYYYHSDRIFMPYPANGIISDKSFIDSVGNKIDLITPSSTIISLVDYHTENIYYFGADDRLIGISTGTNFPYEVNNLTKYSLNNSYDLEQIVKAAPDVVLISPSINDQYPRSISYLEAEGLTLVSLTANTPDDMTTYIHKLSIVLNKPDKGKDLLDQYHNNLDTLLVSQPSKKVTTFIESSERGIRTFEKETFVYKALQIAGGNNVAEAYLSDHPSDQEIVIGYDELNKLDIDLYLTTLHKKEPGGAVNSILQRQQFKGLDVYKDHSLYEISYKSLGQPTLRYPDAVRDLQVLLSYQLSEPSLNLLKEYPDDLLVTRELFAHLLFDYHQMVGYRPYDKDYYDHPHYFHTYGSFEDVPWDHGAFYTIESVVSKAYIKPLKKPDTGYELFGLKEPITTEDLDQYLTMCYDHPLEAYQINLIDGAITVSDFKQLLTLVGESND